MLEPGIQSVLAPVSDIRVLKENRTYRIADLILCKGVRWREDRQTILSNSKYADSILFKYLSRKRYENDIDTLKQAIREHVDANNVEQPCDDELVVHLRLGDVMDNYDKRTYDKCLEGYKNLARKVPIKRLPVKRATLVTAMHFGANEKNGKYFFTKNAQNRSYTVAGLVASQLAGLGLDVKVFSHEDIDLDLCYMVGSRYFLKGNSKLSDLVVECLASRAKHFELRESWVQWLVR